MRVTAEMELDAAEGRKLRFKVGAGEEKEIIRSLARLEKKAVTSAAGLRLGKQEGRMDFCDRHVVVTGGTGALGRAVDRAEAARRRNRTSAQDSRRR